jgi:hypothetical protein
MVVSFLVALYFQFVHGALGFEAIDPSLQLVIGVAVTTVGWLAVTFLTPPADADTLRTFHRKIRPMGGGWRGAGLEPDPHAGSPSAAFLAWFLGCVVIYGALFGTGYLLYGERLPAILCLGAAATAAVGVMRALPRVEIR